MVVDLRRGLPVAKRLFLIIKPKIFCMYRICVSVTVLLKPVNSKNGIGRKWIKEHWY